MKSSTVHEFKVLIIVKRISIRRFVFTSATSISRFLTRQIIENKKKIFYISKCQEIGLTNKNKIIHNFHSLMPIPFRTCVGTLSIPSANYPGTMSDGTFGRPFVRYVLHAAKEYSPPVIYLSVKQAMTLPTMPSERYYKFDLCERWIFLEFQQW